MSDSTQEIKVRFTTETKQASQAMTQASSQAQALAGAFSDVGPAAKAGAAAIAAASTNITSELVQTIQTTHDFSIALTDLQKKADGLDFSEINKSFGKLAGSVGKMAFKFLGKTLQHLQGIGEAAKQLGVSAESFQRLQKAAQETGNNMGMLEDVFSHLTMAAGQALRGDDGMVKAFEALGVSVSELSGKNPEELFRLMAPAIDGAGNSLAAAEAKSKICGEALSSLQGRLSDVEAAAQGVSKADIISDETVKRAQELSQSFESLEKSAMSMVAQSGLVEWLGDVSDRLNSITRYSRELGSGNAFKDFAHLLFSSKESLVAEADRKFDQQTPQRARAKEEEARRKKEAERLERAARDRAQAERVAQELADIAAKRRKEAEEAAAKAAKEAADAAEREAEAAERALEAREKALEDSRERETLAYLSDEDKARYSMEKELAKDRENGMSAEELSDKRARMTAEIIRRYVTEPAEAKRLKALEDVKKAIQDADAAARSAAKEAADRAKAASEKAKESRKAAKGRRVLKDGYTRDEDGTYRNAKGHKVSKRRATRFVAASPQAKRQAKRDEKAAKAAKREKKEKERQAREAARLAGETLPPKKTVPPQDLRRRKEQLEAAAPKPAKVSAREKSRRAGAKATLTSSRDHNVKNEAELKQALQDLKAARAAYDAAKKDLNSKLHRSNFARGRAQKRFDQADSWLTAAAKRVKGLRGLSETDVLDEEFDDDAPGASGKTAAPATGGKGAAPGASAPGVSGKTAGVAPGVPASLATGLDLSSLITPLNQIVQNTAGLGRRIYVVR